MLNIKFKYIIPKDIFIELRYIRSDRSDFHNYSVYNNDVFEYMAMFHKFFSGVLVSFLFICTDQHLITTE